MRQSTISQLAGLLADREPPCISLYLPTHRHFPENQQDPIRYRNLLTEMENSLRQKYPTREVRTLLEKFQTLARDDRFWNHRTDGLAILSSPLTFQMFELQRTVQELLVVADSFHIKPLLRVFQSTDRYHILALNRHEAKLYEGNRYGLDPVELPNVPSTIEEALGEELTEQHLTVASYGAGAARAAGGGVTPSIQRLAKMVEAYQMARSRDLGSDDVARIAEAATAGRVGTLLIEADRQIPGRIDPATGQIHAGDIADPEVDDVLDDLAEHVLRIKGDVVLVPAERMPSTTGAAAIYRY